MTPAKQALSPHEEIVLLRCRVADLEAALRGVLPMAENYLDAQMINPNKDVDILTARATLKS